MRTKEELEEMKKFAALMKQVGRAHHVPKIVPSPKKTVKK